MHVKRIVLLCYIHEALKHRMAGILKKKKKLECVKSKNSEHKNPTTNKYIQDLRHFKLLQSY